MINIIKAILEDAEPVTNQGQYESDEEFKDKGTVSKYKDFTDKVGELKENLYDMTDKIKSSKAYESYPVHKVHYGSIDNNKHDDIDLNNLSKYSKLSSVTDEMLGKLFDVTLSTRLVLDLLNKNIGIIDNIGDHVWESKDKLSDSDFNGARNLVYIYGIKCQELINVVKNSKMSDSDKIFNEAASTDEDVAKYVSELNKLIPEIRDYYDKFQYKELVTPRKKHQEKMESYMRGALRRKYDLRIPIYKIEDPTKDVKHMIRSKFIPAIKSIVNKYPNYQLIVPNFNNEDSDMFIYITLKEPFGDDGDRTDRKEQTTEIKEKKKDIINECSFDYPYDEDDILDESCDDIDSEDNDTLDEGAVQTSKKYKLRNFLARYNFVPDKEANGIPKSGTIEVEGRKYKVDIDTHNPVMKVAGDDGEKVSMPRQTAASLMDGEIHLGKEFEDLKNNKRRDAVLNHELGHLNLHEMSDGKVSNINAYKAQLRSSYLQAGHSKEQIDETFDSMKDDFDNIEGNISKSDESKLRDKSAKLLSKYDRTLKSNATSRDSHANISEYEADRYATARKNGKHLMRAVREIYTRVRKNNTPEQQANTMIKSTISNSGFSGIADIKDKVNDPKLDEETKNDLEYILSTIETIRETYQDKNTTKALRKEQSITGSVDLKARSKALADKTISNKAYTPKRAVRSIGESVEYYDEREVLEEAALTSKQREDLPSDDYGIPSLKAFPINDKAHVQKAIQLFSHAKPKNKKELAKNIADKIIELKLVGKIKVNPKNPNAEYFPKWLATDSDAKCEYNTDGTYLLTFKTESKLGRNMYHKEETTGKVKSAVMQESGIKVII